MRRRLFDGAQGSSMVGLVNSDVTNLTPYGPDGIGMFAAIAKAANTAVATGKPHGIMLKDWEQKRSETRLKEYSTLLGEHCALILLTLLKIRRLDLYTIHAFSICSTTFLGCQDTVPESHSGGSIRARLNVKRGLVSPYCLRWGNSGQAPAYYDPQFPPLLYCIPKRNLREQNEKHQFRNLGKFMLPSSPYLAPRRTSSNCSHQAPEQIDDIGESCWKLAP